MSKITFLGDIMCEGPLLRASGNGREYDFRPVFSGCRALFAQSDLVIGNLETVFAGEAAGYTRDLFSFNTPDAFAAAMAESGIGMVTTATNHALDRDKEGLLRTLSVLDRVGVAHIGAYRSEEERNSVTIRPFDGTKIAFLNYTYGTNTEECPYYLDEREYWRLNLLMPQKKPAAPAKKGLKGKAVKAIYGTVPLETLLKIRKRVGMAYVNRYTDRLRPDAIREDYLSRLENDLKKAKESADLAVVCLHIGGQFNETPGEQVGFFVNKCFEWGADYIVNTHAHVVQGYERRDGAFAAYCLGNFSISPSSVYIPHELKPEYSVALHLYTGGEGQKLTFSILKIVEDPGHGIEVLPADVLEQTLNEERRALLRKDVAFIYNRFTGKNESAVPVLSEYPIEE